MGSAQSGAVVARQPRKVRQVQRMPEDEERVGEERVDEERVDEERVGEERVGEERVDEERNDVFAYIHPASLTCAHASCAITQLLLHAQRQPH
jgi:hypothetical protein